MLCPNCGTENPEQAKFCFECASPLAAPAAEPGTERKVVSVLFCDLVGFTSRSESADPEDVLATVRPYHTLLRAQIEGFGGTVEKFIGDAVMAVFGAPVAHEDDAERAVRSGLRILEALEKLNEESGLDLSVRIGINTGQAVVSLGARPEQGEGIVTGDVVNTAARIQTGAPVGGVAVGEITYRSTRDVFDYEPLDPITAKGKAEPVSAWRALEARARFGTDLTRTHDTPLVGRDVERSLLQNLFERAVRDRSCQLVTIVGEPGVGKSRMVTELFRHIDDERPELITWRQGRCLPYGDGIAFWALGEIVKAHAGILESDSVEEAGAKLETALRAAGVLESGEHEWLKARLAPLVGAETSGTVELEESFTAWRRFLEAMPAGNPAVYVFEDLHWADATMLGFIEHLADWSEGIPMLVVGTARPELSEEHPHWGSGLRNATTMNLAPLSEEETARLIGGLLGQTVMPVEVQAPILERAGGNPLYAEEFIRMLKDRGMLTERGRTWALEDGAEIPFPEGVQGLIAARLDTLSPERKSLLQDAAVIGKVFWSGALSAMGGRGDADVRASLHELSRKEFVRAARQSSMDGESEYAFWHMLVRDIVYSQIPRAARAAKHVAAAQWIEAQAGERAEDLADVIGHHYAEALELTTRAGADSSTLADRSLHFLMLAAARASQLDAARAERLYERSLELAPAGHPMRAEILFGLAQTLMVRKSYPRSEQLFAEAIPAFAASDEPARAADAKIVLAKVRGRQNLRGTLKLIEDAIHELEQLPPSKELVSAYATRGGWVGVDGSWAEAIQDADRSIALAEQLGLPEVAAFRVRGWSRCFSGDPGGIEDIRHAVSTAQDLGLVGLAAHALNDLAIVLATTEGPEEGLIELKAGIRLARRSGILDIADFMESSTLPELLYDAGRWDELVSVTEPLLDPSRTDVDPLDLLFVKVMTCRVATWRGDLNRVSDMAGAIADAISDMDDVQMVVSCLYVSAQLELTLGHQDRAARILQRLDAHPHVRNSYNYPGYLPELVRIAITTVGTDLGASLTEGVQAYASSGSAQVALGMAQAELAEAHGELERAADLYAAAEVGWQTFSVPERAQALLGRGRCLLELGDPEADAILKESREVFASLKANRFLPEVDSLLERSLRLTS